MPRTREPAPREDVPGQSMLFPPGDCPPHPAGPPDAIDIYAYHGLRRSRRSYLADLKRTEALRKRDERREQRR